MVRNKKNFTSLATAGTGIVLLLSFLSACLVGYVVGRTHRHIYLRMDVATAGKNYVQLFRNTGMGYRDEESQAVEIPPDNAFDTIRFDLPADRIKSLRLDISDLPAGVRIRDICFTDYNNDVLQQIDIRGLSALQQIKELRVNGDTATIRPTGQGDAQLALHWGFSLPNHYGFQGPFAIGLTFVFFAVYWCILRMAGLFLPAVAAAGRKSGWSEYVLLLLGGAVAGAAVFTYYQEQQPLPRPDGIDRQSVPFQEKVGGEDVSFRRPDGLKIAGTLYVADPRPLTHPAILILHGNYPLGGNNALCRVLSQELASKGYVVLAIDFAGYGKSDDPFVLDDPAAIDMDIDTRAGLRYLRQLPNVDPHDLIVIGHSMGGDPAMSVGIAEDDVRSLILIGPPRRVFKRFHFPPDIDLFWNWALMIRKNIYHKNSFPEWYTVEMWRQSIVERDMAKHMPYFESWGHKPVLYMDGERERKADREYLANYFRRTTYPKEYVTLSHATHECNVYQSDGRIYYDPPVMDEMVLRIDNWIRSRDGMGGLQAFVRNVLRSLFAVEVFEGC